MATCPSCGKWMGLFRSHRCHNCGWRKHSDSLPDRNDNYPDTNQFAMGTLMGQQTDPSGGLATGAVLGAVSGAADAPACSSSTTDSGSSGGDCGGGGDGGGGGE